MSPVKHHPVSVAIENQSLNQIYGAATLAKFEKETISLASIVSNSHPLAAPCAVRLYYPRWLRLGVPESQICFALNRGRLRHQNTFRLSNFEKLTTARDNREAVGRA